MTRVALVATLLAVACARPAGSPPAATSATGATSADHAAAELLSDLLMGSHRALKAPKLRRYATEVAARVVRASGHHVHWQLQLTDDPDPAANALPGGTLLVSRGALAHLNSEAELAAVIAHELAHLVMRHTDLEKTSLPAHLEDGPSRSAQIDADEERQADSLAVRYVAQAGYDPRAVGSALAALHRAAALRCQQELARDDCDDAHDEDDPHPQRRARLARVALAAGSAGGELGRDRYLDAIDGLALGGARAAIESGRFRSTAGLSFALPPGFSAAVSGDALRAKALDSEISIVQFRGRLLREASRRSLRAAPYLSREIAGQRALIGTFGDDPRHLVAVLDAAPFVHVVAVSGPSRDQHLEEILASVRPVELESRPVVRVVRSAQRSRFSDFVAAHCPAASRALMTALNGIGWGEKVERGRRLKCVATK